MLPKISEHFISSLPTIITQFITNIQECEEFCRGFQLQRNIWTVDHNK